MLMDTQYKNVIFDINKEKCVWNKEISYLYMIEHQLFSYYLKIDCYKIFNRSSTVMAKIIPQRRYTK